LRGQGARRAISVSFRSPPPLLAFVNDVFDAVQEEHRGNEDRGDAFRYGDEDRFPLPPAFGAGAGAREPDAPRSGLDDVLGLVAGPTVRSTAEAVADEIVRVIGHVMVRDKTTGVRRMAQPADLAILFRSRESHRAFEEALAQRRVPTYVYKGLGFFDADEIQDVVSMLRYLADPASDLRAAAFLRSRLIRLSDRAVMSLAPHLSAALIDGAIADEAAARLPEEDRIVLTKARASVRRWLSLVDRITPAELVDLVLGESAYYYEIRGRRRLQARENLKKLRGLIRRIQNRGYATLSRIADHLEQLAIGDESNAAIDAVDAVSLMTVHAAKGLEFPIVFIVNLGRGTGGVRAPIRIATTGAGSPTVAVADFQSEADEDAQAREREDSKRLLYVALTRARDRLYLAATVQNGVCRMGRGSLGEVLPSSIADLFARTAAGTGAIGALTWIAHGGKAHAFRTLRDDDTAGVDRGQP
jgi:ATP-dependent helicase/nuclease subunit A